MLMKILVHPKLERFRAVIPYPIFIGLVTTVVAIPFSVGFLIAQARERPSHPVLLLPIVMPFVIMWMLPALLGICSLLGFVSGFRPFKYAWRDLERSDTASVGVWLSVAAEVHGFTIVWRGANGAFVAVRDSRLEFEQAFHSGTHFPMRLSYFVKGCGAGRCDVKLKLSNRTGVIWDTGETRRCHEVGKQLFDLAEAMVRVKRNARAA